MNFTHTEDRRMLADSLQRYLAEQYPIEARNQVAYEAPYHDPSRWSELAELGILSALVDEAHGGFGGKGFDITVVFEELGRALCPEPMLAALMCLRIAQAYDDTDLINAISSGASKAALAVFEPDNSDTLETLTTTARQTDDGWVIDGRKSVVYGGPQADVYLVAARIHDSVGLFVTEQADKQAFAMIDGGGAAELSFTQSPARCLSESAGDVINDSLDTGRLALCAEAVGAMEVLLGLTNEYLTQRQQFGTPIATFQALQHRLVDMAIELEQCRSMTTLAASKLDTEERSRYIAMAKNLIGRGATLVAEEATQLHGGIGMTWEYAGAHYAKRLIMLDHQLGDRYQHLSRLISEAA